MKRKILLGLVVFSLIGLQAWFAFLLFYYPYLGINVEYNARGEWEIHSLDVDSGSEQLNLQAGDVILAVDDQVPSNNQIVRKWNVIEQARSIQISRKGTEFTVYTDNIHNPKNSEILTLFIEWFSFLIAALLHLKIRDSKSARLLSLVFLVYGVIFMSLAGSIRADILGGYIIGITLILAPIVFLHFLIVFFREKCDIQLSHGYLKYLYGIILVLSVIKWIDFLPVDYPGSRYFHGPIILGFFSIGIFINFYVLSYIYFKYRQEYSHTSAIIKTVWISLFISFVPVIVLIFVPQMIGAKSMISISDASWIVLFFPITFAYLLITKQLYDIDMVLRRIVYTLLLATLPSVAIVGIDGFLFQKGVSTGRLVADFLFVLAIFTFVLYSFEYVTTQLQSVMFPRKHSLQKALKKIARNLGSISSFHELKSIILEDIVSILQVHGGAIVFKYRDTTEVIHDGNIDPEEVRRLVESSNTMDFQDHSCFEINRQEGYTSYLILTRKKTNTLLGMEEIQWLNLIITYLAVSLENIFLIRKLTIKLQQFAAQIPEEHEATDLVWFRKLMFELQENERIRIATDLHDTTMQDLFFLKRRLTSLLEQYVFKKEDEEQMNSMIQYIEVINMNLRQNCFELHPHLLSEIGLVETIRKLMQQEIPACSFDLTFQAIGTFSVEKRDMETKTHVFRIVQELLNNAKKHSQASKVSFTLSEIGESLHLDYEDNGIGFDSKRAVRWEVGPHGMGIAQIKSRILYLNGHWELDTGGGLGVRFRITLPISRGMTA